MRDHELYARILEIQPPWRVRDVQLQKDQGEIQIWVAPDPSAYRCPKCSKNCAGYDHRERRWRHLDTCQYRTILVADVPRVECPDHGVVQVTVPWAEPGSRFTALFEAMVIDWLQEASFLAVARQLRLSWDEVDGIQSRAVARGLARRKLQPPKRIGVDETSFQKRHEYVTVVSDLDREIVLHVADDHYDGSLDSFYEAVGSEGVSRLEVVCMDMWRAYIGATRRHVPDADRKIAFDKYHVVSLLGKAVNMVRSREHRALQTCGDDRLKRTKFLWLTNRKNMSRDRMREFAPLKRSALKTARAWAIKELARKLWSYRTRGWAEKAWKRWLGWALRCRLAPIRKAAESVRKYLWGILNAIIHNVNNALAEGMNSRIQELKRRACGYRNRERFRMAIFFHLGGLDLHPGAHTKS